MVTVILFEVHFKINFVFFNEFLGKRGEMVLEELLA